MRWCCYKLIGENVLVVITSAAAFGKGKSIISKFQLEHYGCKVLDRPRSLGGRQIIKTTDGNIFKLKFQSGLMYLPMPYLSRQYAPCILNKRCNSMEPK